MFCIFASRKEQQELLYLFMEKKNLQGADNEYQKKRTQLVAGCNGEDEPVVKAGGFDVT